MTIAKEKSRPTCPLCGSVNFEEVLVTLSVNHDPEETRMTSLEDFWARICKGCFQVTFWKRKWNE
jgi:predicted nucleic-acid-binding Zn-ribbon protein